MGGCTPYIISSKVLAAVNYFCPTFNLLGAFKQPYLLLISSGQTALVWNLQTTHFHRMSQDVRVLRLFV